MSLGRRASVGTALSVLAGCVWMAFHAGDGRMDESPGQSRHTASGAEASILARAAAASATRVPKPASVPNPFSAAEPHAMQAAYRAHSSKVAPADAASKQGDSVRSADPSEDRAASNAPAIGSSAPRMVDLVLAFDAGTDLALVRSEVEALGGRVTREYQHLRMRAVRVPEDAVAALTQRADVVSGVPDEPVMFLAQSAAQQTSRLPPAGSPHYVSASPSVGIAVLDSGVAEHADLNVVEHVQIVPPATYPVAPRADGGVVALYIFDEGNTDRIFDRATQASGAALPLQVDDPLRISLGGEGLGLGLGARLRNTEDSNKIYSTCKESNAVSVEAWIKPATAVQLGPARIVTMSLGNQRNFSLIQTTLGAYEFRLRTSTNGLEGSSVVLASPILKATTSLQHVVVVRGAGGGAFMFVNGQQIASRIIGGTFSNWSASYDFMLGNEADSLVLNGSWQGDYRMVAVHCAALTAAQVAQNYAAGPQAYATLYDPHGHGTHVAGIIGGNGSKSGGVYMGMAPGAAITDVRVLAGDGRGTLSDVIAGLDWVLAHHLSRNIRIVNLSLGKPVETRAALDPLVVATEAVWDAGLVVVASAGNFGTDGAFHITSPGNSPKVITVGSVTDRGTGGDFSDDFVSSYSSHGPTAYDHYLKPDLLAPGNRIVAATPAIAGLKAMLPSNVVACGTGCTGQYMELSGTSMSAAVVSGALALMMTNDDELNTTIKARLMRSTRKIPGDPTAVGAGVLDVESALQAPGFALFSPSPQMVRVFPGTTVYIQDTRVHWGLEWNPASIWSTAASWSGDYSESGDHLTDNAYLWSDGYLWSDTALWDDAYLWSDAYMWSDAYLWSDNSPTADPQGNSFDRAD